MKFTQNYAADFETTVYDGQTYTEVWAAGLVSLDAPNMWQSVEFYSSLDAFMKKILTMDGNVRIYFHNLKFDGSFILDYLIKSPLFVEDSYDNEGEIELKKRRSAKSMGAFHYSYNISNKGQWYQIMITGPGCCLYIVDSLKLIPMSLRKMGKDFKTPHQKLTLEYTGERHAGHKLTEEERRYLANDVLVLKESLNIMFDMGIDSLTIGSACLKEFKELLPMGKSDYRKFFPDMTTLIFEETGETVDEFCRSAYHGGWCYCKENGLHVKQKGYTDDVNSLYPSMMHSMSGNVYPVGYPFSFWGGLEHVPSDRFYFIRFECEFYLKKRKLPCVQIKNSFLYDPREWLKTSDVDGKRHRVTLTMCKPEFELFCEMYDVVDPVFYGGVYFNTESGIFDRYIDKWAKIKMEAGENKSLRTIAKLFLNNLYGKMASSECSSYKMVFLNEEGALRFREVTEYDKETGYIPIGAAITAYARCFTIRAAVANYDGFCYADTDSIHCTGDPKKTVGVPIDPVKFCCWKTESCWDEAVFARQKTYIEHVVQEDLEDCEPYWNIKCAGMGEEAKKVLMGWLENGKFERVENGKKKTGPFAPDDFRPGLIVPGNLKASCIPGGVLLKEMEYKMR